MPIEKITEEQIKKNSMERLSNRPTAASRIGLGGLSPEQLKKAQDALALLAIAKINELIELINADASPQSIAALINTPIVDPDNDERYKTLYDVLMDIINGDLAGYLALTGLKETTLWKELHYIETKAKSAYDIAVEHGFEGTEEEWLKSLTEQTKINAEKVIEEANTAIELLEKEKQEAINEATEGKAEIEVARVNGVNDVVAAKTEGVNAVTAAKKEAVEHIASLAEGAYDIVQEPGDSENKVMSQKASTEYLDAIFSAFETEGGYNLLDPNNAESGYYQNDSGVLGAYDSTRHMRTVAPIPIAGAERIYIASNVDDSSNRIGLVLLNENGAVVHESSASFSDCKNSVVFKYSGALGATQAHIWINSPSGSGLSLANVCISTTETEFESYGAAEKPIALKYDMLPSEIVDEVEKNQKENKKLAETYNDLLSAFETEGGYNLLNPNNVENGYYENASGVLTKQDSTNHLRTTNPFPIIPGGKIYIRSNANVSNRYVGILLLDENDTVVYGSNHSFSSCFSSSIDKNAPSNATKAHIWVSGVSEGSSLANICISTTETEFEPYGVAKKPTALKYDMMPSELVGEIEKAQAEIDKLKNRTSIGPVVIDNFQTAEGWITWSDGTITADTTDYLYGAQSLKFETVMRKTLPESIDMSGKEFRVKFKVNSMATAISELWLEIYPEGDDSVWGYWSLHKQEGYVPHGDEGDTDRKVRIGEWVELVLPWSDIKLRGIDVETLRSKVKRITFRANNGGSANIQRLIAQECKEPRGVLSFTFDDGFATDRTKAAPILGARGIAATSYIIPNWIGKNEQWLSEEQVISLKYDYGWDIEAHEQRDLETLTESELIATFENTKAWVKEKGLGRCEHLAYPYGNYGNLVEKVARRYFTTARLIDGTHIESTTMTNPYRLTAYSGVNDNPGISNIDKVCELITKTAQYGGWLILVFHEIADGTGFSQCSESAIARVADHAIASGIEIKTVAEVIASK